MRDSGGITLPWGIHWSECMANSNQTAPKFHWVIHFCIPVMVGLADFRAARICNLSGLDNLRCADLQDYTYSLLLQSSEWFLSFTRTAQSTWKQIAALGRSSCNLLCLFCLVNNSCSLCVLLMDPCSFTQVVHIISPKLTSSGLLPPYSLVQFPPGIKRLFFCAVPCCACTILLRVSLSSGVLWEMPQLGSKLLLEIEMLKLCFRGDFKKTTDNILACVIHSDKIECNPTPVATALNVFKGRDLFPLLLSFFSPFLLHSMLLRSSEMNSLARNFCSPPHLWEISEVMFTYFNASFPLLLRFRTSGICFVGRL